MALLTWKPVPRLENTAPRGEFELKKFAGRLFGALNVAGTPSQLISRRPLPLLCVPAVLGLRAPSWLRNAVTVPWMSPGAAPAPEKTFTFGTVPSVKSLPVIVVPAVTLTADPPSGETMVWPAEQASITV